MSDSVLSIVNTPPAKDADNNSKLVPPPGEPLRVAQHLLPDWRHQGELTLRHWRGSWIRWRRSHWAEVEPTELRNELYKRLGNACYDTKDGLRPWAPTRRKLADLEDALAAQVYLPGDTDAPAWLNGDDHGPIVACRNGLLRVRDRQLMEHTPQFFNLAACPCDYTPDAPEPKRWLEFLSQLWPDDEEAVRALQEFFGYILSGRTDLHKILLMVGQTRSGKGTIGRVLTALVGKRNMAGPTLASLGTNFGLAPLLGKPLAIVSDARLRKGSNAHLVVERLLTISGEDTIDVDRKYRDPWTGRLPTRFMILSNELPDFADASGAIARRFIVLTLRHSFLGRENPRLTRELLEELPGILNWSLDGLARLEQQGAFTEPESSVHAVQTMVDSVSPESAFIRECCTDRPDATVPVDDLFRAWQMWCYKQGRTHPGNKQTFGRNLHAALPHIRKTRPRAGDGSRQWVYEGLGLLPEVVEELRRVPQWLSGGVGVPGQ